MAGLLSLSSTWQTTARANSSSDSANTAKRRWNYPAPFFIEDIAYGQATEKIRYHRAMGQTVEIAGQTVSIHYSGNTLVSYDPVVYLHSLKGNGSEVWGQCQSLNCPPFTLISIPTPNWNNSLTPWKCEGLFAEDKPFEGNARQHLLQLETIVAQTEKHLGIAPQHRCIAGYSLAGLFCHLGTVQHHPLRCSCKCIGLAVVSRLQRIRINQYLCEETFVRLFFPRYKRSKNTQPPSSQRFAKNKKRCFVVSGKKR